jgi:hypothetical protein
MASTQATTDEEAEDVSDREDVLALVEDGLDEAHAKVTAGRVYDAENEKVRQGWMRTLGYLAGQYRQLKKDQDLEEMNERLERLEEAQGIDT